MGSEMCIRDSSKSGLSKILKKLRRYKIVEETLVERGNRKVKGYISTVKSLREADIYMALCSLLDEIDEKARKRNLTDDDVISIFSDISDYLYFLTFICLERMFTYKKASISKISNFIIESLRTVLERVKEYPHLHNRISKNFYDIVLKLL